MAQVLTDFQIWCNAVGNALTNLKRPFHVNQLDDAVLQAAFNAGTSPVVFARSVPAPLGVVSPVTVVPIETPISKYRRFVYFGLNALGWLVLIYAAFHTYGLLAEAREKPPVGISPAAESAFLDGKSMRLSFGIPIAVTTWVAGFLCLVAGQVLTLLERIAINQKSP